MNAPPIQKGHILIIDDEADVLTALRRQLKRDFIVFTASSAKEGYIILEENFIDVVISDQRMPDVPGNYFLAKAHELSPRTKLILLTGYSDMSAIIDSVNRAHIFSYIEKPWNIDNLRTVVNDAYAASKDRGKQVKSSLAKTIINDIVTEAGKLCVNKD